MDTCNEYVNKSNTELRRIKTTFSNGIEGSFGGISNKLTEGAKVAEKQATNTCCRWGSTSTSTMSTSSARHPAKGYPFNTYMAAVPRHGEFRSPTYGYINFNEDLTNPILKQQAIVWDRVFNHEINEIIVKVVNDAFNINTKLAEEMQEKVVRAGFSDTKEEEMLYKITNRLSEMSRVLHFKINSEQRELSRSITPPIQATAIQDVEHVCALLVEDLKTGLKLRTVTQTAANGALLTALKNCAKMLRPKTSSSSCQFPQDTREFIGPRNDKQNSNTQPSRAAIVGAFQTTGATNTVSPHKRKQDFDDNYKDTKREKPGL